MPFRTWRDTFRREALHAGGRVIRHLGLMVGGVPNGLGQDKHLLGGSLPGAVILYFADPPRALYQLQQWYGPLAALHRAHGLTIITRDSRTAKVIRSETDIPLVTLSYLSTLDDMLSRSAIQLVLYVNFSSDNFKMLRFTGMIHAALGHGDSDKLVSVSNQVKAFDFNLVQGQAAIDRLATHLRLFDAAQKCIIVGRPQMDRAETGQSGSSVASALAAPKQPDTNETRNPNQPIRVLYAPTWEGGHPSVDYGSVESHAAGILAALLADQRFSLTYRPHPLSGDRLPSFGAANLRAQAQVEAAARANPSAGHRVSRDGGPISDDFAQADLLITDISSVATDWLTTGRPLLITVPASAATVVASTRLLDQIPRLKVADLPQLADFIGREVTDDPHRANRTELANYYLYSTKPGQALAKFASVCDDLIALNRTDQAAGQIRAM